MTKDAVLAILKRAGTFVSGEKISQELGISRTAVNIAVKALREEGCVIASSTNRGYCLTEAPDRLTRGDLLCWLPEERMTSVLCMDSVDSTNRRLRELALDDAPDGQVLLADEQTDGRGRRGRAFYSPAGSGIYLSMLLRPEGLPADTVSLTAWAAVAVCRAVASVCGVTPGIKWVNDLVLQKRKVCGILTEMSVESETGQIQYVIVGIGVNVNEKKADFPKEIRTTASSLAAECGRTFSRAELAAAMIRSLDQLRADWPAKAASYLAEYRAANITAGQEISVLSGGEPRYGTALAVNEDFSLSVRFEDGKEERLTGGGVSIREWKKAGDKG